MKIKLLADSSCDLLELPGVDFTPVPLTISTDEADYVDDAALDIPAMLSALAAYHGRSRTACPSVQDWLDAFEGADVIYAATMTGTLSGTWRAAEAAKALYQQAHPDARVCVFDSKSTGPELRLLVEKLAEGIAAGEDFDAVCAQAEAYLARTRLFFSLESLHNMAQNGRVSKLTAAAAGVFGIRVLGTASPAGELQPLAKCRGEARVIPALLGQLEEAGYRGGRLAITHIENPALAEQAARAIRAAYPGAQLSVSPTRGLCSYYAERGGLMVGCACGE